MKPRCLIAGLGLLAAAHSTRADIVEWQDADGVRHFTNSKEAVPSAGPARVVVVERAPQSPQPAEPAPAPAAAEPPRQAQVVYDYSPVADAYVQGLEQGLALARARGDSGVTINGPVGIADALGNDGGGYPSYAPPYAPLVTTSFDRGRSRFRTLRMLLQDQFQLDRDGPFLSARVPRGRGPNLSRFLPRGLPHGFPARRRVVFF